MSEPRERPAADQPAAARIRELLRVHLDRRSADWLGWLPLAEPFATDPLGGTQALAQLPASVRGRNA